VLDWGSLKKDIVFGLQMVQLMVTMSVDWGSLKKDIVFGLQMVQLMVTMSDQV